MSDEPLGDDSKPRSHDVTFSNPLFDLNDDYTLCYDNPLFDEEFEDISSLDPPKSAPLNCEPLGNSNSMSRSVETSDLILEELTAEIGLDESIPTEIDDGYYDSEGDILFLIPFDLEDLRACFQSSNHAVSNHFHDYILGILNPHHIYILLSISHGRLPLTSQFISTASPQTLPSRISPRLLLLY
ncbi:hypothetical protein Tco_0839372 [Tanacetum coccineum]|uniref:Uncharacterized protein n=1 Tax=Tanacetum coccineum TaxID=301880 RepID=A0ABQ5AQE9_9ASTR